MSCADDHQPRNPSTGRGTFLASSRPRVNRGDHPMTGNPPAPPVLDALGLLDETPALIWRARSDGGRVYFSRAWLEFTGRGVGEEEGWGFLDGLHPDDRELCRNAYAADCRNLTDLSIDFRLERYDGEYRWLTERSVPTFSSEGEHTGFAGFCVDVTARKLLAGRLEETSEQLAVLVEALPDA